MGRNRSDRNHLRKMGHSHNDLNNLKHKEKWDAIMMTKII